MRGKQRCEISHKMRRRRKKRKDRRPVEAAKRNKNKWLFSLSLALLVILMIEVVCLDARNQEDSFESQSSINKTNVNKSSPASKQQDPSANYATSSEKVARRAERSHSGELNADTDELIVQIRHHQAGGWSLECLYMARAASKVSQFLFGQQQKLTATTTTTTGNNLIVLSGLLVLRAKDVD